jgi:GxxExxY protein
MQINDITGIIVDSCIKIHNTIGPGCFERVYEECLHYELVKRELQVQRQMLMPINYEELYIDNAYKLDLLIEGKIIVEIKCSYELHAVHFKQLNTYLKLMNLKHGLILNFKTDLMKDGIHRVFNNKGKE